MYIEPNSDIYLIKGCPLDADYENTAYFSTLTAQKNYFLSMNPMILSNYYYQRKDRGYIRVGKPYSECYNINYMMFKNTNPTGVTEFENKWWYAFVDSVEYINDSVTELHYTIDVIQSWWQVFVPRECFIERQHSLTDGIGDNIAPENIDPGEYVYNNYDEMVSIDTGNAYETLRELSVIIAVCDTYGHNVAGNKYDGVYGAATLYAFPFETDNDILAIDNFLGGYITRPQAIVGMYLVPRIIALGAGNSYPANHALGLSPANNGAIFSLPYIDQYATLDGYIPKNKKLFTFPYTYLQIDNSSGGNLKLRYEYFQDKIPRFLLQGCITQPVSVRVVPVAYKNAGNVGSGLNPARGLYNEVLTLGDYPMCSWNFDSFKAWLAQESIPTAINIAASLIPVVSQSSSIGNSFSKYDNDYTHNIKSDSSSTANNSSRSFTYYPKTGFSSERNSDVTTDGWRQSEGSSKGSGTGTRTSENKSSSGSVSVSTGSPVNAVAGALSSGIRAGLAADMFQGSASSGSINVASGNQIFRYGRVSCKNYYAQMIDDYFTMFGYADKTVHVPNMHARSRWTYVKTVGCHVEGLIPNDDKMEIQNIFDRGVRFWVNPAEIGMYNLTNSVLT